MEANTTFKQLCRNVFKIGGVVQSQNPLKQISCEGGQQATSLLAMLEMLTLAR